MDFLSYFLLSIVIISQYPFILGILGYFLIFNLLLSKYMLKPKILKDINFNLAFNPNNKCPSSCQAIEAKNNIL